MRKITSKWADEKPVIMPRSKTGLLKAISHEAVTFSKGISNSARGEARDKKPVFKLRFRLARHAHFKMLAEHSLPVLTRPNFEYIFKGTI